MPDRRGSGDQALEEAARNTQSFRRSGTDLERKANTSVNVAADEYDIWGDFDDGKIGEFGRCHHQLPPLPAATPCQVSITGVEAIVSINGDILSLSSLSGLQPSGRLLD